jgi:uncharacterized protein (TIGR02466 family)
MEKHAWNLFPTLVHQFKDVLSPEQLALIREDCLNAEAGKHDAFVGATKSSFSRESRLIETLEKRHPALRGLKQGIAAIIDDYAQALGFENVAMTNSWFNVQYPGSVLKHHVHPDSRVSIALCIAADEKSSMLFLENPNPILNLIRPDNYKEGMFEFMKFRLFPGDMLLFPSWIKHGSGFETNESDARIMISANAS